MRIAPAFHLLLALGALAGLTACGGGATGPGGDEAHGSTVGLIANNFSVLDCTDQQLELHSLAGKHRAVLVVMAKDEACEACRAFSAGYLAEIAATQPDIRVIEVLGATAQAPQSGSACATWSELVGAHHQVVRDTEGTASAHAALDLAPLQTLVTDRDLRIAYRGESSNTRGVDDVLDRLKETDGTRR